MMGLRLGLEKICLALAVVERRGWKCELFCDRRIEMRNRCQKLTYVSTEVWLAGNADGQSEILA
jgi:hypothetical protein